MIEQTTLHGRLYVSKIGETSISSRPIAPKFVQFGPVRHIHLFVLSDTEAWIEDIRTHHWYHYQGRPLCLQPETEPPTLSMPSITYYYGQAIYEQTKHLYFVRNLPIVTGTEIPDTQTLELPITLQKFDYNQTFTYPEELRFILSGFPASYVDRYKRPIRRLEGRTYPTAIEKVTTTMKDLPPTTYPIVVNLRNTPYAVADLEPHHTEQDLQFYEGLPGYYEEETPRGGRHKLLSLTHPTYKFRYSEGLEIINESMVTFYGINPKWISNAPEPIDLRGLTPIGGTESHSYTKQATLHQPNVTDAVEQLEQKAKETFSGGKDLAARLLQSDPDRSHGEFVALQTVYQKDIAPYASQFPDSDLPWIVTAYADIPYREKHDTLRAGLPYLVYLANIIINRKRKKEVGEQWQSP